MEAKKELSVEVFLLVFVPLAVLMTAGLQSLLRREDRGLSYVAGPFFALCAALLASSAELVSTLFNVNGEAGTIAGLLFFIPFFGFLTLCGI